MTLLGIDIGSTNCKVGLFGLDGRQLAIVTRPTPIQYIDGAPECNPEKLWQTVVDAMTELMQGWQGGPIAAIGVASMAESGLLLSRSTHTPLTPMILWFDTRSASVLDEVARAASKKERYTRTGLYPSYKYSLVKLLWLRKQGYAIPSNSVWLSAADYIVFRLTGHFATDYTLAARTYAFELETKQWERDWLREFSLTPGIFPDVLPSGCPVGVVNCLENCALTQLQGVPVAVSGHDHICSALAVGAVEPGIILDSMGTAETLVGAVEERSLGDSEFQSGLTFGCHVVPQRYVWMGGLSASGGSMEWIRRQLAAPPLDYHELLVLLRQAKPGPTGIIYLPYLSGSDSSDHDLGEKGVLVGLTLRHTRSDLVKAILEGCVYEMESVRRVAERITATKNDRLVCVGGGTKNSVWLQIKATLSGCVIVIPPITEATVQGAAFAAAIGCGVVNQQQAVDVLTNVSARTVMPDSQWKAAYQWWYHHGYERLVETMRGYFSSLSTSE